MIQRTNLPNIAKKIKNKQRKFYTQQSFNLTQNYKLHQDSQVKQFNTQKSKISNVFQKQENKITEIIQTKRNVSAAPYFFKIHNSLNLLQYSQQLKKQKHHLQTQSTRQFQTLNPENSSKKLISQLSQINIDGKNKNCRIQANKIKFLMLKNKHKHKTKNDCIRTQESQNILQRQKTNEKQLQMKKKLLNKNALGGQYSFKYFNSGQIFNQIAQINQKLLYKKIKNKSSRKTENKINSQLNPQERNQQTNTKSINKQKKGIYFNNKNNKNADIQSQFKEQYNNFLKNVLPPSFGQNGNKQCIYQKFVQNSQNLSKSKILNKTGTQKQNTNKQAFIFSNQIKTISANRVQVQNDFYLQKAKQQQQNIQRNLKTILNNAETVQSSHFGTKVNTKMNTLRHNQSLISKVKLKKLAKQSRKQNYKTTKNNGPQILNSLNYMKNGPSTDKNRGKKSSSLSNYRNVTQNQIDSFLYKTNQILGKRQSSEMKRLFQRTQNQIQGNQVNIYQKGSEALRQNQKGADFRVLTQNKLKKQYKQEDGSQNQINQYQVKHLQNMDKLLGKWVSKLRKQRQDLDSLPWRLATKVQNKKQL